MREYVFIIEKGTNCWGAYSPDLPGLGVTGNTAEEAEQLIREGIQFHLEELLEHGDPVPEPTTRAGTVKVDLVESYRPPLSRPA